MEIILEEPEKPKITLDEAFVCINGEKIKKEKS